MLNSLCCDTHVSMAPPCPVETGEGGQGANGDDARQRRASDASSGGVSTTPPQRRLSDLHDGASPPSVMRPPSNPREPFVVDAADFSAGKCTPFVNLDTEAGRLATFRTRWRVTSDGGLVSFPERRLKPLTPAMLAKAGFLYCPDAAHADRCVCFCCNRALHTWDPADNPLYEHCRVNAECPYVQAAVSDDVDELRSRGLAEWHAAAPGGGLNGSEIEHLTDPPESVLDGLVERGDAESSRTRRGSDATSLWTRASWR